MTSHLHTNRGISGNPQTQPGESSRLPGLLRVDLSLSNLRHARYAMASHGHGAMVYQESREPDGHPWTDDQIWWCNSYIEWLYNGYMMVIEIP